MKLMLLALLLLPTVSFAGKRGQDVGNGGDIIICRESPDNELKGNYSLDYVLTYQGLDLEDVDNWGNSLERIATLLKTKVPELYMSFKAFQDDVFNQSYSHTHVWEKAPFGLTEVNDENIAIRLPDNCLDKGKFNLIQAVIRMNPDYTGAQTQIFKYMPKAFETLEGDRQVQASFLLVHEWLWELSKNVDRNRRINRYLHSKAFTEHSGQQALLELRGMGLQLTGDSYAIDSISAAVESVAPGSTVWLLNKTYEEKEINITKSVHLKVKSPDIKPVVTGEIKIDADEVSIEGLSFDGKSGTAIMVWRTKNLVVKNCSFKSYNQYMTGIDMWAEGRAEVTYNTFEDMMDGIEIRGKSTGFVEHNKFKDVFTPIDFSQNGWGWALQNEITGCGIGGVEVDSNETYTNPIRIANNTITECKVGLWLKGKSNVLIEGNRISKSIEEGIFPVDYVTSTITGNTFTENNVALWDLSDGVTIVNGNNFTKNRVGIDKNKTTQIGTNTFKENETDVRE